MVRKGLCRDDLTIATDLFTPAEGKLESLAGVIRHLCRHATGIEYWCRHRDRWTR